MNQSQLAIIFDAWAKRYAEKPEEFGQILDAHGKPDASYGENAAVYFHHVANEVGLGGLVSE